MKSVAIATQPGYGGELPQTDCPGLWPGAVHAPFGSTLKAGECGADLVVSDLCTDGKVARGTSE